MRPLDAILADIASESASGSLRIDGPAAGTIFFESGRIYFAVFDRRPLTADELARAGIEHAMWQQAGGRPGARGHFADELVSLGCQKTAIERFVLDRITACLGMVADEGFSGVERGNGRHGFGSLVSFPAERFIAPRGARSYGDDMLVSLSRTDQHRVSIDAAAWNAIVGLVPPMRFAELIEALGADRANDAVASLETGGLLSVVSPHSSLEPRAEDPRPGAGVTGRPATPNPFLSVADDDDDYEEYVPERVGRQTYAAIASMRASRAEPPPQEKAHALKRLIEAVRGL